MCVSYLYDVYISIQYVYFCLSATLCIYAHVCIRTDASLDGCPHVLRCVLLSHIRCYMPSMDGVGWSTRVALRVVSHSLLHAIEQMKRKETEYAGMKRKERKRFRNQGYIDVYTCLRDQILTN